MLLIFDMTYYIRMMTERNTICIGQHLYLVGDSVLTSLDLKVYTLSLLIVTQTVKKLFRKKQTNKHTAR